MCALYGNAYSRAGAAGFLARYPELRIEVEINNQPVSLVGERIDVAIRITDNPEPGVIARRLGDCESVLCASEGYLHQHGIPQTLEDLAQHNCLYYSGFAGKSWHFLDEQGEAVSVAIRESQRRDLVAVVRICVGRHGDRAGAGKGSA